MFDKLGRDAMALRKMAQEYRMNTALLELRSNCR